MTEPTRPDPAPPPADLDPLSFEQLMEALEAITARLAGADIGIEEAADLYEQAERLHAKAAERLAQVSERVARLSAGPGGLDADR